MEPRFTYFFLDLITIAGPLALSFDQKVAFYKQWKHWFIATLITSTAYILWDIWFTYANIWKFNDQFLTGTNLVNLPIEEYTFFMVVPYACLFVYACLRSYFPNLCIPNKLFWPVITAFSVCMALYHILEWYTFITFGLFSISLLILQVRYSNFFRTFSSHLWWAWVICLIPMAYVNGVLTSKPVLIYNNLENCGFRIGTIPFEDFFYNFLYMTWMIVIYEISRRKSASF